MKRMKRYVAWLMAICMLNFGGAWTGISVNAQVMQDSDCDYDYTILTSGDASGNGTASVAITNVAKNAVQVDVPATCELEVSGDASGDVSGDTSGDVSGDIPSKATYNITKLTGISFASGDASGNALKIIGFEGAPEINTSLSGYYVKVLKSNASIAESKIKNKVETGKYFVVDKLTDKIMVVTKPKTYASTFGALKNSFNIGVLCENQAVNLNEVTIKWYDNENYTGTPKNDTDKVESGKTYYFSITKDGFAEYKDSLSLSSNELTYEYGNCVLTLQGVTDASGNASGNATATITGAEYKNGYTYNAADIYNIPSTATIDGVQYTITKIDSNAFGKDCYFTSYYIPKTITDIGGSAFYCESDWNSVKNTLLLRFEGVNKDELPKFQSSFSCNDFGLVFSTAAKDNNVLEKLNNQNKDNVFYVENPASDKILKKGNVTPSSNKVLYTDTLAVVTLTPSGFKDFQTKEAVTVVAAWVNPGYPFSFKDNERNFDYTCTATGYAPITDKMNITPYAASGFTYDYKAESNSLYAAGYDGQEKVVKMMASEIDATGESFGVTGISKSFVNNTKIEELTLTAAVTVIEDEALSGCTDMKIKVDPNNPVFTAINDFLYSKDGTKLIAAPSAWGEVFLPEGILIIGDYAFYQNGRVQSIVIPTTVVKVGENKYARCFQGCSSLRDIKFCNTNPTIMTFASNIFDGGGNKRIHVPTGTTAAYQLLLKDVWGGELQEWVPTTSKLVTLTDFQEVTITPTDNSKAYTWTSDNTSLVVVTPAADGKSATIHATGYSGIANVTAAAADGTSTSWQVTVNIDAALTNPWAVPQYSLKASKSSVTMGAKSGKKVDSITLTVSASDKSKVTVASATTSNKKVATVTKKGNKITIKSAAKKGTATITITDANGKTAKVKVTVKAAPKKVKLKKSSITLKKKKSYTIALKNTPSANVSYKSSNKKVATVSSTGKVTAKKKGKCKITVTIYNGKKATLKVKVK